MNRATTAATIKTNEEYSPEVSASLAWVKRKNVPRLNNPNFKRLSIADFFCGCGGLTLGAAEAARRANRNIEIRAAIDCDKDAIAVYRQNFSENISAIGHGDISQLIDGEVSDPPTSKERAMQVQCEEIDALLAGPPCQGHSDLNNSTRRDDPRNKLYLRAVRGIEILRPRFAFIENVPGVVHDKSDVVNKAIYSLEKIGYVTTSAIIDMQNLGLPQKRRRHVLFAARSASVSIVDLLPVTNKKTSVPLGPFISGLEDEGSDSNSLFFRSATMTPENDRRIEYLFAHKLYNLPDSKRPPCHRDKPHSYQSVYGRLKWGRPAQTITSGFGSPGQGRFIHPRRRRLITPHEAARIQGFPDFYDFSSASGLTALRTMIGNAVPPPLMIQLIGSLFTNGLL